MRILTLWRPWPWLIIHGGKPVENRTWAPTADRGRILLHAGQHWDPTAAEIAEQLDVDIPSLDTDHPVGIVASVDLRGVCSAAAGTPAGQLALGACRCGPWAFPGQHHWRLTNIQPIDPPIPWRGQPGLRWAPPQVKAAVLERLGAEALT